MCQLHGQGQSDFDGRPGSLDGPHVLSVEVLDLELHVGYVRKHQSGLQDKVLVEVLSSSLTLLSSSTNPWIACLASVPFHDAVAMESNRSE